MRTTHTAFVAALLGGAAAVLLLVRPAAALDGDAEQARISQALDAGYRQGYAAKDASQILALYDADAEIVTFTAGRISKASLEAVLARAFQGWQSAAAKVSIEKAAFPSDNEALVTFSLQVSGTSAEGKPMVRQDRLHAALRRSGDAWVILRQGYREDFGVSSSEHSRQGPAPAPPAGHGAGGGWH